VSAKERAVRFELLDALIDRLKDLELECATAQVDDIAEEDSWPPSSQRIRGLP